MKIINRKGQEEQLSLDKILKRIRRLCKDERYSNLKELKNIDPDLVAQKVTSNLYDGITSMEIDEVAAKLSVSMILEHPEYSELASRIIISNMHKSTPNSFSSYVEQLSLNEDMDGEKFSILSKELLEVVKKNKKAINSEIDHSRDYDISYFGYKTLEKSYLLKYYIESINSKKMVERPQYMFMRVALGIHGHNLDFSRDEKSPKEKSETFLDKVFQTYNLMSKKYFTHATPTLFNAGTYRPQLLSCYLLSTEDSLQGIYKTITKCAEISKWAGGIGVNISDIRPDGSLIRGTNGRTEGIVPMLKVYNDTARYINQCFVPETIVYGINGPKYIKDIKEGDQLFTIDGSIKNVHKVFVSTKKEKILEIRSKYSTLPIRCTKQHVFYVLKKQKKITNFSLIKNRLDKELIKIEECEAKDIKDEDFVIYPIPKYTNDIEDKTLEFFRFYGIMLGDGYISIKKKTNKPECGVSLNTDTKLDTILFVQKYLESNNIHYWTSKKGICYTIRWTGTNFNIKYEDLYDKSKEKMIKEEYLNLPRDKLLNMVKGMLETDGSVKNEIYYGSTSKILIQQLRYILLKLGILTSGHVKDNVGSISYGNNKSEIITKKLYYVLRIPKAKILTRVIDIKESNKLGYFEYNGMLFSRINYIKEVDYEGEVYDLGMEDNHNYLTNTGIVHNSGRRLGSFAFYLEPWHGDILEFLDMKKPQGDENRRARDLFYALWIPDLFMEYVKKEKDWYLMCPKKCPGLTTSYGKEFEDLYHKYVNEGKYIKVVKARKIWNKIIESQIESGVPYISYKDSVNRKSNQKNVGVIKGSNLCVAPETKILTSEGEIEIQLLKDKEVEVWNGYEFSKVVVKQTSEGSKLLRVRFSNGSELYCTYDHKFYISFDGNTRVEEISARDLKINMLLKPFKKSNTDGLNIVLVDSVSITDRVSPTYCFTEPKRHAGIFNGVLTGQCNEIVEYSSDTEYACCTLASLGLPAFVEYDNGKPTFNFQKLEEVVRIVIRNLNKVIDINWYPVPETELSNKRHRPLGLGVQGLADVFMMMKYPFDSKEAKELNKLIFETIYYSSVYESVELSKEEGPYSTFKGSPASKGILQWDMWGLQEKDLSGRYNWKMMKEDIKKHGMRNSLLVALMPTASSASILGNIEAFEPITSNIYTRKVLSGEFIMINKHLMKDLVELGLWNKELKDKIVHNNGSVQDIEEIPKNVRELYKTVWEISQKVIIDLAADRGAFVCQTQSMNIFIANPTLANLTSMHFYGHSKGLKTGSYYIRSKPAINAVKFTLDPNKFRKNNNDDNDSDNDNDNDDNNEIEVTGQICTMEEGCITCSS